MNNNITDDLLRRAVELFNTGIENFKNELFSIAEINFTESLNLIPNRLSGMTNLVLTLIKLKKYHEAIILSDKIIYLYPNDEFAYFNRGSAQKELNQFNEALKSYELAIFFQPNYVEAYFECAQLNSQLQHYENALSYYNKILSVDNTIFEAYFNRGNLLKKLNRYDEALENYDKANELNPRFCALYYNIAIIQNEQKKFDKAIDNYKKAIEINPKYKEAYINQGNIFTELYRFDESLNAFNAAINLDPFCAVSYNNIGIIYQKIGDISKGLHNFEKAISINPEYIDARYNRGNIFFEIGRFEEALVDYEYIQKNNKEVDYLFGSIVHAKLNMCDWSDFDENISKITDSINRNFKIISCVLSLALIQSPSMQRRVAEIWSSNSYTPNDSLGTFPLNNKNNKITIGYFSADFREHPVSYLTAELFELHDRTKFEVIGFYTGPKDFSEMHHKISSSFDKFINISELSDIDAAKLSRSLGIDIAIDLTGITNNERVGIFSCRAAPIQISYIGYLGTLGASYYDYLIADKTIIPASLQKYYTEKIIYLNSFQVNDTRRIISDKVFTRSDLNLPEFGFIFCCFNNNFKISPIMFNVWMNILKRVPESVLLVLANSKLTERNLRNEASIRGVASDRIIFSNRLSRGDYLSRYKIPDLFLDTFPYNAGTTASDALWSGLPVLTYMGQTFSSRVAASILNSIGLPELISTSFSEYEQKAVEIALSPDKHELIKNQLVNNKITSKLFDTKSFVNNIEDAYFKIYQRYRLNLDPDHIY